MAECQRTDCVNGLIYREQQSAAGLVSPCPNEVHQQPLPDPATADPGTSRDNSDG